MRSSDRGQLPGGTVNKIYLRRLSLVVRQYPAEPFVTDNIFRPEALDRIRRRVHGGRQIAERLMGPAVVIIANVFFD
jgi:hypothetical protein